MKLAPNFIEGLLVLPLILSNIIELLLVDSVIHFCPFDTDLPIFWYVIDLLYES
jgi:hypothetical protein